jgi:hypothetical protein
MVDLTDFSGGMEINQIDYLRHGADLFGARGELNRLHKKRTQWNN